MDTGPLTRPREFVVEPTLERSAARRSVMKLLIEALAALLIGAIVLAVIGQGPKLPDRALGELRCEGHGAIVIKVDGKDYAVNGMAGSRYPPIQTLWNQDTHPEADIDRLIVQGITLCAW